MATLGWAATKPSIFPPLIARCVVRSVSLSPALDWSWRRWYGWTQLADRGAVGRQTPAGIPFAPLRVPK